MVKLPDMNQWWTYRATAGKPWNKYNQCIILGWLPDTAQNAEPRVRPRRSLRPVIRHADPPRRPAVVSSSPDCSNKSSISEIACNLNVLQRVAAADIVIVPSDAQSPPAASHKSR